MGTQLKHNTTKHGILRIVIACSVVESAGFPIFLSLEWRDHVENHRKNRALRAVVDALWLKHART